MVMRKLLELPIFDKRRSVSKETSRNYEYVLVVGQPVQISLQNLAPDQSKFVILNFWWRSHFKNNTSLPFVTIA